MSFIFDLVIYRYSVEYYTRSQMVVKERLIMSDGISIESNLRLVEDRIKAACEIAGRNPSEE